MRLPGAKPRLARCAAMRRASSTTCAHVKSTTTPPPIGCVSATRSGAVRSQ